MLRQFVVITSEIYQHHILSFHAFNLYVAISLFGPVVGVSVCRCPLPAPCSTAPDIQVVPPLRVTVDQNTITIIAMTTVIKSSGLKRS